MTDFATGSKRVGERNTIRTAAKWLKNKPQQARDKGMTIGQDWKIGSDSLNIILYRRGVSKKTGKEYWRAQSYYSSLGNALMSLVDQGVRETQLADLKTVCDAIDQLRKDILEGLSLLSSFRKQERKQ